MPCSRPWTLPWCGLQDSDSPLRRSHHAALDAALLGKADASGLASMLFTVDGLDTPLEVDTKIANSSQRSLLAGTPASRAPGGQGRRDAGLIATNQTSLVQVDALLEDDRSVFISFIRCCAATSHAARLTPCARRARIAAEGPGGALPPSAAHVVQVPLRSPSQALKARASSSSRWRFSSGRS